jgi:DNA ligase-1
MAKREFLQLAHDYTPKHMVSGHWWSEKIDGHRGFWDGGMTRGFEKSVVPWANTAKDKRYKEAQISTGLWSRYGNVIHAPSWFLNELPKVLLDAEFSNGLRGPGNRQLISSTVKKIYPVDSEWEDITMMCFDMPPFDTVFANGTIDNIHYKKQFFDIYGWCMRNTMRSHTYDMLLKATATYRYAYDVLGRVLENCSVADRLEQHQLSFATPIADAEIEGAISEISRLKGEGLMIRNPDKYYECERSYNILKVKRWKDAEAVVVGYTTGRETDKGSKLLGLMGALIVEWNGNIFELSGFKERERQLTHEQYAQPECAESIGFKIAREWAEKNPGVECPSWVTSLLFPRGSEVTFKYQGLTRDGIPNPASYWRKGDKF